MGRHNKPGDDDAYPGEDDFPDSPGFDEPEYDEPEARYGSDENADFFGSGSAETDDDEL